MTRTVRLHLAIALGLLVSGGTAAEAARGAVRGAARTNVNQNVNVNRDVDVYVHGGYGGCCHHPVATAAAVTATAVVTAAVVGSILHTLPPSCTTVVVNGFAYQQCGTVWYQPQFSGTTTTYVLVNSPR